MYYILFLIYLKLFYNNDFLDYCMTYKIILNKTLYL